MLLADKHVFQATIKLDSLNTKNNCNIEERMNNIEKFESQVCDRIEIFTASALYRMDIIEIKKTRIVQTCVMKSKRYGINQRLRFLLFCLLVTIITCVTQQWHVDNASVFRRTVWTIDKTRTTFLTTFYQRYRTLFMRFCQAN